MKFLSTRIQRLENSHSLKLGRSSLSRSRETFETLSLFQTSKTQKKHFSKNMKSGVIFFCGHELKR